MSSAVVFHPAAPRSLEDPLVHLPCSAILKYDRGETIYNQDHPSYRFFLVVSGKVKASRITEDGRQIVIDIYQPDEFFGESALLGMTNRSEVAVAFEATGVMTWTASEIEAISIRQPMLAIALMQLLVRRSVDFTVRIESFSVDKISRRLARVLLNFSERFGSHHDDGSIQMIPFTHEFLAQYIGTSREIVTLNMNLFRKQGYLEHSRKGISVYQNALKDWLHQSV